MAEQIPEERVVTNVQFLRGMAALMVVAAHFIERMIKYNSYPDYNQLSLGGIGVEVFFAISGFIMVHTSIGAFQMVGAPWRFISRRFFRVAPFYYVTTAAMIIMTIVVHKMAPPLWEVVRSYLFLPEKNELNLIQPVYGVGWTLNYEMFFYALFSLALLMPPRVGIGTVVAILSCLCIVGALLESSSDFKAITALYFYTRPVMMFFAIGMFIAVLRRRIGLLRVPVNDWAICGASLLSILFSAIFIPQASAVFVVVSLLLCTILRPEHTSPVAKSASTFLGDISYSLYLTHSFVLGAVAFVFRKLPYSGPALMPVHLGVAFAVCVVVAWAAWRYFERPVTAQLNRKPLTKTALQQPS